MPRITKKYLENIFRNSDSSDELFDTFRIAIDEGFNDALLYRILLWNKALSPDEIMMFAEKICKENPDASYQIYSWVGKIFSSISVYGEHHEKALDYFRKAAKANPSSHESYIAISKLYNSDLNIPRFEIVIKILEKGVDSAEKKSKLCFAISKLYKTVGNTEAARSYQILGEKYQRAGK